MSETSLEGYRGRAGESASLAEAVQALDDRVREALERLARIESRVSPTRDDAEELARRLRDALEDLDVCQAECVRLTDENEPLRSEHAKILTELNTARQSLADAQATIRVMEGTRGWKILVRLRRLRERISGRG